MLNVARVLDVPSPYEQQDGVCWENPSKKRIVQLDLKEDVVLEIFPTLEDAYQFVASLGRFKEGAKGSRGYLPRGLKRRDGRYLWYRWVTEYDYVHGNYEPLIENVFPEGDPIVQMFADSNKVVNVYQTPKVASEISGIPLLGIRMGVVHRNGYSGGYRWTLKSRYDKGIYPNLVNADRVHIRGELKMRSLRDAVVVLDRSGTVLRLIADKDTLRLEYHLDGLAEITLSEMGVLPRGSEMLMLYSVYQERQIKKEKDNPFNNRYVVEVSVDNKVIREFRTISTLSRFLGISIDACKERLQQTHKGHCWMYKTDYYKNRLKG